MNEIGRPPAERMKASASTAGQRSSVPIDLVVFAVRVLEFLTVIGAGISALLLWSDRIFSGDPPVYGRTMLAGALIFALVSEIMGSYDVDCHFSLRKSWERVLGSWMVTGLFLLTIGFLLKVSEEFSRGWAITWFVTAAVMLAGTRAAMTMWIRHLKGQGVFNSRVAIYGASAQGQKLAQYIRGNSKLTISLVGFFDDRRDGRVPVLVDDLPVFGTTDDLVAMIRDDLIDQVIVALPWSAEARIRQVVQKLALTPVRIRLAPDLANFAFAHRPLVLLGDMPVITLFERPISGTDALVKRAEDLVLTICILLFVWPVMLLAALAVKLDSPGPIFFRQPREGFNNQRFNVLKFRSMMQPIPATLTRHDDGSATLTLNNAQYGISPGQAAVCYDGERMIGGGWIQSTENSTLTQAA